MIADNGLNSSRLGAAVDHSPGARLRQSPITQRLAFSINGAEERAIRPRLFRLPRHRPKGISRSLSQTRPRSMKTSPTLIAVSINAREGESYERDQRPIAQARDGICRDAGREAFHPSGYICLSNRAN